jgi:hypothetical protein
MVAGLASSVDEAGDIVRGRRRAARESDAGGAPSGSVGAGIRAKPPSSNTGVLVPPPSPPKAVKRAGKDRKVA